MTSKKGIILGKKSEEKGWKKFLKVEWIVDSLTNKNVLEYEMKIWQMITYLWLNRVSVA